MHIVGYDTPDGPKCVDCTRGWVADLLDAESVGEQTTAELVNHGTIHRPEHVYDVGPIYATDLACSLCENMEDHNPDAGECLDEVCEDCGNKL